VLALIMEVDIFAYHRTRRRGVVLLGTSEGMRLFRKILAADKDPKLKDQRRMMRVDYLEAFLKAFTKPHNRGAAALVDAGSQEHRAAVDLDRSARAVALGQRRWQPSLPRRWRRGRWEVGGPEAA